MLISRRPRSLCDIEISCDMSAPPSRKPVLESELYGLRARRNVHHKSRRLRWTGDNIQRDPLAARNLQGSQTRTCGKWHEQSYLRRSVATCVKRALNR